jgi:hypothetical protein
MSYIFALLLALLFFGAIATPEEDLTQSIQALKQERQLKGIQLQVSKNKEIVFNLNLG